MKLHLFRRLYDVSKYVLKTFYRAYKVAKQGSKGGHTKGIILVYVRFWRKHLDKFVHCIEECKEFGMLDGPTVRKHEAKIRGLHSLLPDNQNFRYSILIPVYNPNPVYFEKAINSTLHQTAPNCEILLGLDGPHRQEIWDVISKCQISAKELGKSLKIIEVDREKTGGGISRTTNELAKAASGNYLLLMDHDDWIKPDLLYRYELCLRLYQNPDHVVLYCNEYKINEKDEVIAHTKTTKPEHPTFPYLFVNYICHCLLIPKTLWDQVGGLRPACDGAQDFDLCLRLETAGANFQIVPFALYAWRSHPQSTAKLVDSKDYATQAGIRALEDYTRKKSLNWEIQAGKSPTTYRAIPKPGNHTIQVVIPYKDQKELTLKAVRSILAQKDVRFKITAVDNRSTDQTIAAELESLGVEVLHLNEPFNYSRINNYAVKNSKHYLTTDSVLFLNNDVELEKDCLLEMSRWLDQPKIGMVGARLHYPNGLLQHGGVVLGLKTASRMSWEHIDYYVPPFALGFSSILSVCDALTAACLMMKKSIFLQVGGFDEIWYPIAFSDTDLAVRVRRLGLYALYTPWAAGVHHESASRGPGVHEEPDASYWLFRNTERRQQPQEKLRHQVFLD